MKGQLKVSTPEEYIAAVDEARRADIAELDRLIRQNAPDLEPFIQSGILAYGPWHYKYESGREGDWFRIGVASNASYISLYIVAGDESGYVAEQFREALPKAKIGKSCVRFKKLSDLDQKELVRLIQTGAKTPGKV